MYINFWYPAEQSPNITDAPLKLQMPGQNFVLGSVPLIGGDGQPARLDVAAAG